MITLALVAVVISLIAYVIKIAMDKNKHWERKGIKYNKPILFFGNSLPMILGKKGAHDIIEDLYKAYPKEQVLGHYEFMSPRLIVRDPELVNKVLIKDFGHFTDHGVELNVEKNPLDEQLFVMTGTKWRAFRIKLSPIFTSGKLKDMFSTMTSCGDNLLAFLEAKQNEDVDGRETLGLFSMDVIGTAVFGMDPATLKNPNNEFREMGKKLIAQNLRTILRMWFIFAFPKLTKKLGVSFQNPKVTGYFSDLIKTTLDCRKENSIYRNDFVQMMMQLKNKGHVEVQSWDANDDYLKTDEPVQGIDKYEITDDILLAQAQAFMIAGFEATALIMVYNLYELSLHQDIQDKVREEILEQVNLHGGLTYDSLKNMKLLDCTIKETQRMYPLVPYLFRVCTKEYELPNGYVIKKGDPLSIPVAAIHMDPANYPNPKEFKPERFLEPMKPGTFLPFGEGPRICIAMRYTQLVMKYGLALIYLNHKVKLSPKTKVPLEFDLRIFGVMPKGKILLNFEKFKF